MELDLLSWGVQKSFSSPNDPLCEFLKFPRRVQKIISPQNDTNRDFLNIFHHATNLLSIKNIHRMAPITEWHQLPLITNAEDHYQK